MPAGKALRRFAPLLLLLAGGLLLVLFRTAPYAPAALSLPAELRAARAAGLPLAPDDLRASAPPAPAQNAAPLYREIAQALAFRSDVPGHEAISNVLKRTRTDADRWQAQTRLAALAPVLALAERAAARPRCDFARPWEEGVDLLLPEYATGRALVRLFAARAILRSEAEDAAGALNDVATGARICRHMGEDPVLIAWYVQLACRDIMDRAFTEVVLSHDGDPEILRRAAAVEKTFGPAPRLRHALRGDVVVGRITIQQLARRKPGQVMDGPPEPQGLFFERAWIARAWEAGLLRYWRRVFAALDADPNDLGVQWRALMEISGEEKAREGQPASVMSAILAQAVENAALSLTREEARTRLRRTLLALVAHRQRTGRFPAALSALSSPPPPDVFTGRPLIYRRTGNGFVLYSVGENGRDDAGKSRSGSADGGPDDIVVAGP